MRNHLAGIVDSITRSLGLCLLICVACCRFAWGLDFHVSRQGSDAQSGTVDRPFATIARAKAAVRKSIANGLSENLTVFIHAGTYWLDAPLVFDAADGGDEQFSVTFAAADDGLVVISGGAAVGDWRVDEKNVWTATLPVECKRRPRDLMVNGRRAIRARSPNDGYFSGMKSADGKTVVFPADCVADWTNPGTVELVTLIEWSTSRAPLPKAGLARPQAGEAVVTFPRQVLLFLFRDWAGGHRESIPRLRFYFENAREMLDQPGEWFFDFESQQVHYLPRGGERPDASPAVVPVLETLLDVRGTPEQPVRNLHFSGLTLVDTTWQIPAEGYFPDQAGHVDAADGNLSEVASPTPAATVRFSFAQDCQLRNCTLERLGGVGIDVASGSQRVGIHRCTIRDVGGNGIEIGELASSQPDSALVSGTRVEDCEISVCGVENRGAVGIGILIARDTLVAHNAVHDLPYSGISCGWNWTHDATSARDNRIEYNHLHHTQQVLADSGGIYTIGKQPGSRMVGNHIHDIQRVFGTSPNTGIFQDNGSEGWHLEGNIIYRVADGPISFNRSDTNEKFQTWGENWFDIAPDSPDFPRMQAELAGPRP